MLRYNKLDLWNVYLEKFYAEKCRQPITKQSFRYTIVFAVLKEFSYHVANNCFESETSISYGTASIYSLQAEHISIHEWSRLENIQM